MKLVESLVDQARASGQRIVLSEGEDPRIVEGAVQALASDIAVPVLLGNGSRIESLLKSFGCSADQVEIIDPSSSAQLVDYATAYHELRAHKGMDADTADKEMRTNPLAYAAMMVRQSDADATN